MRAEASVLPMARFSFGVRGPATTVARYHFAAYYPPPRMEGLGAQIVTLDEFAAMRDTLGKVVATSGGFDPIHPGHISCIIESQVYGDVLVVIVNGDSFLAEKKGKPFQDVETRALIVSGVRGVDYVVPFDSPGDPTVSKALEAIRPDVFTKGGDRVDATDDPRVGGVRRHRCRGRHRRGAEQAVVEQLVPRQLEEGITRASGRGPGRLRRGGPRSPISRSQREAAYEHDRKTLRRLARHQRRGRGELVGQRHDRRLQLTPEEVARRSCRRDPRTPRSRRPRRCCRAGTGGRACR